MLLFRISLLVAFLTGCSSYYKVAYKDYDGPPGETFSVVTYNVKGLPTRKINYKEISDQFKKDDFVFMQEVFAKYSKMQCAMPHMFSSEERDGLWWQDGLARFSKSPIIDFRREKWRCCSWINDLDCIVKKGFSVGRHLAVPTDITIYNVHMDAGRTKKDRFARFSQKRQLELDLQDQPPDWPIVVVGDFNDLDMELFGFKEVCKALYCSADLDKVFYRDSNKYKLVPISWEKLVDVKGSDHYPIKVVFELEEKANVYR